LWLDKLGKHHGCWSHYLWSTFLCGVPVDWPPHIAPDFDVPIHQTGILLTVSAAVCAVSAPVIAAVFRRMAKRSVVVCGLCIFCAGKLMAATSSSFMVLVVARAISPVAAAAFSPAAYALASASV
jgi:DHA1 family inner membrane transport protein